MRHMIHVYCIAFYVSVNPGKISEATGWGISVAPTLDIAIKCLNLTLRGGPIGGEWRRDWPFQIST